MAVVVPREMENRLPESMISVEPTAMMPTNAVEVRIALRLLMLKEARRGESAENDERREDGHERVDREGRKVEIRHPSSGGRDAGLGCGRVGAGHAAAFFAWP